MNKTLDQSWQVSSNTYICKGLIRYEPSDDPNCPQYAAYCENLPGVVSQGDTCEEAIKNLQEAFALAIESYLEDGDQIPWQNNREERWEREISVPVTIPEDYQ